MTSTGAKHLLKVRHMLTKPSEPQPQLATLWGPPFALTATEWKPQPHETIKLKLFLRKNGLVQSSYEEKFHLNTRLGYCDIFIKLTRIAKNVLFSEECWGIYGHNPKKWSFKNSYDLIKQIPSPCWTIRTRTAGHKQKLIIAQITYYPQVLDHSLLSSYCRKPLWISTVYGYDLSMSFLTTKCT